VKNRLQFGVAILAAVSCTAPAGNAWAQKPNAAPTPQSHPAPSHPSQPHPQKPNTNRPPANANRAPAYVNRGNNRPPQSNSAPRPNLNNANRPHNYPGNADLSRRQQMGASSPRPWIDTMRNLSPQQRERVLQNSRTFQNLAPDKQNKIRQQFNQWDRMTPSQRADLQQKERIWAGLTPGQQDHIRNEVFPKWQQMPWDRQQVMRQKLGVLQNMPESARNQRLNDPNFTKGMNDEERSLLRDLGHTHVGAPEPPGE
jgi:hypothetical protein